MRRTRYISLAISLLAVLALAAPAAFANYHDAIRDCNDDGVLQGQYSAHEIRQAIRHLPSSLEEYSDCRDVLRAYLANLHKPNRGRGSHPVPEAPPNPAYTTPSGAVASSQRDFDALKAEQKAQSETDRAPAVKVGGHEISPGTAGLATAAARTTPNELPLPVLLTLAGLAAIAALAAALLLRQRWPHLRRVALRIRRR